MGQITKIFLLTVLLVSLIGLGLTACSEAGSDQSDVPTISLNPQSGGLNTAVNVFGQNFPAGTPIMIRLGPPDVGATPFSYGSAVADVNGRFVVSFLLPDRWPDNAPITETNLTVIAINEDGSLKATAPFAYQPGVVATITVPAAGEILTPDPLLVMNEEAIVTAVNDYLVQSGEPTQVAVSVERIEGEFARVRLIAVTSDSTGNATGYLKQVDSTWQVLVIGQDFDSDLLLELGIPTTILPEELLAPAG